MNFEKSREKINSISNRGRLILGLCVIAAALLLGAWSFDLIGGQPDEKEPQNQTKIETDEERRAREAHEKFFDTSTLKERYKKGN